MQRASCWGPRTSWRAISENQGATPPARASTGENGTSGVRLMRSSSASMSSTSPTSSGSSDGSAAARRRSSAGAIEISVQLASSPSWSAPPRRTWSSIRSLGDVTGANARSAGCPETAASHWQAPM
jgi:hypothetical protein